MMLCGGYYISLPYIYLLYSAVVTTWSWSAWLWSSFRLAKPVSRVAALGSSSPLLLCSTKSRYLSGQHETLLLFFYHRHCLGHYLLPPFNGWEKNCNLFRNWFHSAGRMSAATMQPQTEGVSKRTLGDAGEVRRVHGWKGQETRLFYRSLKEW